MKINKCLKIILRGESVGEAMGVPDPGAVNTYDTYEDNKLLRPCLS